MKRWKPTILKLCMLLAAVFLIGAVPASAKAAPKLSSKDHSESRTEKETESEECQKEKSQMVK